MTNYTAYIDILSGRGADNRPFRLSKFSVGEQYNSGWSGNAVLSTPQTSTMNIVELMQSAIGAGYLPGVSVSPMLVLGVGVAPDRSTAGAPTVADQEALRASIEAGDIVRLWPSVLVEVEPIVSPEAHIDILYNMTFVDPISYLATRPIWGAYRACSVAEMIGGAISLAAGGDGKPTLDPALPGLPAIRIIANLRQELAELPYSIASGETLGAWLNSMQSLLGIRAEMRASLDDSIELILTDRSPVGLPLNMNILVNPEQEPSTTGALNSRSNGRIYISKLAGRHGAQTRGTVVDDPVHGGFRRFGTRGAVGTLVQAPELSLDEASKRARQPFEGLYADMLALDARSKQPAMRPGRRIRFDLRVANMNTWQVKSAYHIISDAGAYTNKLELIRGDASWHVKRKIQAAPLYATGIVDGGNDSINMEPVFRDELGRIPITLSFLPTPVGEDALLLEAADTNRDNRVTLDDFVDEKIQDYQDNEEDWEEKERRYRAGEYDDPNPNIADDDLDEDTLAERNANSELRADTLNYIAYKRAKVFDEADKDHDSYVTVLDENVSDELSNALDEPGGHGRFREHIRSYRAGTYESDYEASEHIARPLLEEYESIYLASGDEEVDPEAAALREAELAKERWPARIPLTVIGPMASGQHGFIPAHRKGDICRVAIHSPLFAEIIGFQYRSDRRINGSVLDAAAGMVVEHDFNESWSGMAFFETGVDRFIEGRVQEDADRREQAREDKEEEQRMSRLERVQQRKAAETNRKEEKARKKEQEARDKAAARAEEKREQEEQEEREQEEEQEEQEQE